MVVSVTMGFMHFEIVRLSEDLKNKGETIISIFYFYSSFIYLFFVWCSIYGPVIKW